MTKHEEALLNLAKTKLAVATINEQIANALSDSREAAYLKDDIWESPKNKWLELAYQRTYDPDDGYYYDNHDYDVEGFLAERCPHALRAHQLIQQRKPLIKARGTAQARVTALGNQLLKQQT